MKAFTREGSALLGFLMLVPAWCAQNGNTAASPSATAANGQSASASTGAPPQPPAPKIDMDSRGAFEVTAYTGASLDSFASNETKDYIGYTSEVSEQAKENLQDASGPQWSYIAGIDFAFRTFKYEKNRRWPVQLWLYGETMHGQRSTEVDCLAAKASEACTFLDPGKSPAFLSILRNSTSLEAYAGARLEFLRLNPDDPDYSVNLYAKTQLGFMTIQKNGGDVVDDQLKVGLGLIMTNGKFQGSYFEAGFGRSDLFFRQRGRRLKVDGFVQWKPADKGVWSKVTPFIQMTVDADMGPHSDSIRTYYGFSFDIDRIFGN